MLRLCLSITVMRVVGTCGMKVSHKVGVGMAQDGDMRCGEFKLVSKEWQKKEKKKLTRSVMQSKKGKTNKKRMNHGARTLITVLVMTTRQDGVDRETTDGLRRLSSSLQDMLFSMLEAEEGRGSEEGRSEKGKEEH
ncbi:hypothetical protein EI94DRAFT_1704786 [Lactarius quietus]|nr:hypothetical protein EI94DRAFT_1704786 [Lactarius quietus]